MLPRGERSEDIGSGTCKFSYCAGIVKIIFCLQTLNPRKICIKTKLHREFVNHKQNKLTSKT